jgi:hypothetical protein
MSYEVYAGVRRFGTAPLRAQLFGDPGDDEQTVANLLLLATADVQAQLGETVQPSDTELSNLRNAVKRIAAHLDDAGVPQSKLTAAVTSYTVLERVGTLADEVRVLRDRATQSARERHLEGVVAEIRTALGLPPDTPVAELPGAVRSLDDRLGQSMESLRRTVQTIREVREALKVPQGTFDAQLGRIAAAEHETLVMVDGWLRGRVHDSASMTADLATRAAVRLGMFEVSVRDAERDQAPVSPEQLARAIHAGIMALPNPDGDAVDEAYEDAPPEWNEWRVRVSEVALSELPQIARRDAEADERFAVHADATQAELQREIVRLRAANAELERAGGEASADMSAYRGVVMFVADQLGIPAERVDGDPKLFGKSFREAMSWRVERVAELSQVLIGMRGLPGFAPSGKFIAADAVEAIRFWRERAERAEARPVLNVCAPAPEDWTVTLAPVLPGARFGIRHIAHGGRARIDGTLAEVSFRYTGDQPQRPDGELLSLTSVSPSELAQAWFESSASSGVMEFVWVEFPDLHEAYVEHARKVIKRLASTRNEAIRPVQSPGVMFVRDEAGDVMQARAFKLSESTFKFEMREDADLKDAARAAFAKFSDAPDAEGVAASAEQDVPALLEQVRELGALTRSQQEELLAAKRRVKRMQMHLGMFREAAGVPESVSPFNACVEIRRTAIALEDEVRGRDQLVARVRNVLRAADMDAEVPLSELCRVLDVAVAKIVDTRTRGDRLRPLDLAVALDRPDSSDSWEDLLVLTRARGEALRSAERTLSDRSQDLKRGLGFSSDESWEDMIEEVTGRTARHGALTLECNAFAEIRRILGLHEKTFPAGVVDKVRELRGSVIIPGVSAEARRIKDAVETLLDAAGIDLEEDFTRPDVTVQKAGDAAAILRSWPDVLRAVNAFDGDEVEQPDEVAPTLEQFVKDFRQNDRQAQVLRAIERMLAARSGEVEGDRIQVRDDIDTLYQRLESFCNLFDSVRGIGGSLGLVFEDYTSQPRFAEQVLLAFHEFEDKLRDGLSAFDIGTPTLAEVPALLEGYAQTYRSAGRYQAVLHEIEIMLSAWTGEPKRFDDATLKQRLADWRESLTDTTHWAACAETIAARLEHIADNMGAVDSPQFVEEHPGLGGELWHRKTLRFAASVVRGHAAALMGDDVEQHPLVRAVVAGEAWLPELTRPTGDSGELHLAGTALTDNLVLSEVSLSGEVVRSVTLDEEELAPVGAAMVLLRMHQVRAKALVREPMTLEQAAVKIEDDFGDALKELGDENENNS